MGGRTSEGLVAWATQGTRSLTAHTGSAAGEVGSDQLAETVVGGAVSSHRRRCAAATAAVPTACRKSAVSCAETHHSNFAPGLQRFAVLHPAMNHDAHRAHVRCTLLDLTEAIARRSCRVFLLDAQIKQHWIQTSSEHASLSWIWRGRRRAWGRWSPRLNSCGGGWGAPSRALLVQEGWTARSASSHWVPRSGLAAIK